MSVFKYFKNIPRSPSHRATGPMCNFFFQICNEVPGEKKTSPVARWGGDRGLSPGPRAPAAGPGTQSRQGPVAPPPPAGDRGLPLIKAPALPFPPHLSPKIPPKIQKKREEWGEGKRRSPAGFSTCDLQVSTFSLNIVIFKYYVF